tara:strand:+ start:8493 stop:8888 length:396 start_codon:yes stop_codon:yes gene_type:complete
MAKPKIISFKTASAYHLAGSLVHLEWEVKGHFFVMLKVGKKIKFFSKNNKADLFLYANEKAKLYAIGDFAISTKEIDIVIQNTNTIKQTYQLKDNVVVLNDSIDSTKINDIDMSLSNINFKIKDININQKL